MNLKDQDDLAKLAHSLIKNAGLTKQESIEAISRMYDLSEDMAWAIIVRGKYLAAAEVRKAKGRAA